MGDLLQGGALTALRAPGAACFTTVLPVGWGEPLKGCGDRAAPQAKVRGAAAWGCQGPRAGGAARWPQLPGLPERANFSPCTNGKSGSSPRCSCSWPRCSRRAFGCCRWPSAVWSPGAFPWSSRERSEEHTSELQSHSDLVCRLLLVKKKTKDSHAMTGSRV